MTGIDRVELAYLRRLSAGSDPFFALARTARGYLLLDKDGAREMAQRFVSKSFGDISLLKKAMGRSPTPRNRAATDMRKLAVDRCLHIRLGAMLRRHMPDGSWYFNTGITNLDDTLLGGLHSADIHIAVLVHDVIPVEAPQYSGDVVRFKRYLDAVERNADLVIYNSRDTRARTEAVMATHPPAIVAHLGVEVAVSELLPLELKPKAPYFVYVSTIEPRKNHALLLDIWEDWGETAPKLVLVGGRGWKNTEVFERLDRGIDRVIEAPDLSDGQVSSLLIGSNGLLFPSRLEGFGLPPMEAAMLEVPVLAAPLPALREVMGDIPIYEDISKPYRWRKQIEHLAEQRRRPAPFLAPTWTDHFNTVLRQT